MFEIGFSELLLIFVISLIVLGPQKLPKLAAQVGRWAGKARAMARQFREQLESEVNLDELTKAQAKTPPPPSPSNPWDPVPAEPVVTPDPVSAAQPEPSAPDSPTTPPVASAAAEGASPYANPWDAPAVAPQAPPEGAAEPTLVPPNATHPAAGHDRQA